MYKIPNKDGKAIGVGQKISARGSIHPNCEFHGLILDRKILARPIKTHGSARPTRDSNHL